MNIVLISTYELGRQPFGLASPAAWLRKRGHRVVSLDLARQSLDEAAIRGLTIEPAKALMIDKRVGSLEVGKDADIVILTGSILDPRNYVVQVLIDGSVAYDIKKEKRRF